MNTASALLVPIRNRFLSRPNAFQLYAEYSDGLASAGKEYFGPASKFLAASPRVGKDRPNLRDAQNTYQCPETITLTCLIVKTISLSMVKILEASKVTASHAIRS